MTIRALLQRIELCARDHPYLVGLGALALAGCAAFGAVPPALLDAVVPGLGTVINSVSSGVWTTFGSERIVVDCSDSVLRYRSHP